jgi:cytoskeleton protein RodZ
LDSFDSSIVEPLESETSESEQVFLIDDSSETENVATEAVEEVKSPALTEQEEADSNEINVAESATMPEHQAELIFSAVKDCWVEVTDAQQQILYYDLVKADNTVRVVGNAPIKVLLGNATNVNVTVNGNQFDTSSFIHGDVARFTVGVES